MPVHRTQRGSSEARSSAGAPFRRRFTRKDPKLNALLGDPLTHLIMRADGVDLEDLVQALNVMADKLLRQEIAQAAEASDVHAVIENKYRPGVGMILLNKRNQIFVGRRHDVRGNAWQLPQGGIDDGESPAQAALRELKEEVGTDRVEIVAESKRWFYYDLPKAVAKRSLGGRWHGQRQKWFVMRLIGSENEIDIATVHPEFDRWRWITIRQLPDIAVSFKRQLYLSLVGEFGEIVDA
jgi:putative (di)nucleoside polyphosphate hydrolase